MGGSRAAATDGAEPYAIAGSKPTAIVDSREAATSGIVRTAILLVAAFVACGPTAADSIVGYVEGTAGETKSTFSTPGELPVTTEDDFIVQRFSLLAEKRVFPHLSFTMGGIFERTASRFENDGESTDAIFSKLRPRLSLRLATPVLQGEVAWDHSEDRQDTSVSRPVALVRQSYSANAAWFPEALPNVRALLQRTETFDTRRRLEDTTDDLFQLTSEYRPLPALHLYYRGSFEDVDDRIERTRVETTIQSGRVLYDASWWDRRVTLHTDYNVNHLSAETVTAGSGQIFFPVFPVAGLSAIDETPDAGTLDPNPALIDENFSASAGINLGLPPAGGDSRARNIGLDLQTPTAVNSLYVWVDRELPPAIAGALSWQIWTSDDNQRWTQRRTLFPAPFGPFLNRFELFFDELSARYVKLVVAPLSPTLPDASSWPNILVTELQPSLRRPASDVRGRSSTTAHAASANLRWRVLERPGLWYELGYLSSRREPAATVYTVANGLYLSHRFDDMYSVAARITREDGRERRGDRSAYLYTASLAVVPYPGLTYNLVASGRDERIGEAVNRLDSVLVNGSAALYRGVDVNVSASKSFLRAETGVRTESTELRLGAFLEPHRTTSVSLYVQDRDDRSESGDGRQGRTRANNRAGEIGISYRPLPSLYAYGAHRIEDTSLQDRNTIDTCSLNWSPFPYGTLRLTLAYTETRRSQDHGVDRIFTPGLRWDITPRWYLNLTYESVRSELTAQDNAHEIVSATTRLSF